MLKKNNFLPEFIAGNYQNNILKGKFCGSCLFMDLSGFTIMTEQLMSKGIEGAEILSNIINRIFSSLGNIININNGFIINYIGDSFLAVFNENNNHIDAGKASLDMIQELKKIKTQKTRFGVFEIIGKICIGHGEFLWNIIGHKKKTYYFQGSAVKYCIDCIDYALPDKVIIHKSLHNKLINISSINKINNDFYQLLSIKNPIMENIIKEKLPNSINTIFKDFFIKEILDLDTQGEFRDTVNLLLGFDHLNNDTINHIKDITDKYGKHNFRVVFGDKGWTILIIFGAPVSYENNIQKAVNLILSLRKSIETPYKAGITYGSVFAGLIGNKYLKSYDILGSAINLSARFMEKAEWGDIWISKDISKAISKTHSAEFIDNISFKGFVNKIPVYRLIEEKKLSENVFFDNELIGRKEEKEIILSFCSPAFNGIFAGVIFIYGNAGIGKSRLSYEVLDYLKNKAKIFLLKTDNIIRKGLNPFINALKEYFHLDGNISDERKKELFAKNFQNLINNLKELKADERVNEIIPELNQAYSALESMLGIDTEDSFYISLDAKSRYSNILYGIKNFFKAQSLLKPVIILLDDLHWVDKSTIEAIDTLSTNIDDYPISIIVASRYRDDGQKPRLSLNNNVKTHEIELSNLNDSSMKTLIYKHLSMEIDNTLFSFIKERTSGNPFFIEQFCNYLKENQLIIKKNDKYSLSDLKMNIPKSINQIIISRIDRLSHSLKTTVQFASVLGREFEISILKRLLLLYNNTLTGDIISNNINSAQEEQIWAPISEILYIFKHTLLYESVYEMQLRSHLRFIHKIAAETILLLYPDKEDRYAEIGYHFHKAEIIQKAVLYYEKALEHLLQNYDNQKALDICIDLISLYDDHKKVINIYIQISKILITIGKWDDALKYLKKAESLNKGENALYYSCRINHLRSRIFNNRGQYDESTNNIYCFIDKLKNINEKEAKILISKVYSLIGNNYHAISDYEKAMGFYEKVISIANVIDDKESLAAVYNNIGLIYYEMEEFDKSLEYYKKSEEIRKKDKKIGDLAGVYTNLGLLYYSKGDFENSLKYYNDAKEIQTKIGDKKEIALIIGNMGNVYFRQRHFQKALDSYTYLNNICRELGDQRGYAMSMSNIASIYLEYKGDIISAENYFLNSIKIFEEINEKIGLSISAGNLGRLYLMKDDFMRSEHYLNYGLKLCNEINFYSNRLFVYEYFTELYYQMKEYDKAMDFIKRAFIQLKKDSIDEDTFTFFIIKIMIESRENKQKSIDTLQNILESAKDESSKAEICFYLYQLTKKPEYRNTALDLFDRLMKEKNCYFFRKKIRILKNPLFPDL